jgi:surface polysaccharide O-acyltransferase-like enzyme
VIRVKRWTESLNKCSYGIYIFHPLFIAFITGDRFFPFHDKADYFSLHYPVLFPVLLFAYSFSLAFLLAKILLKTKIGKYLIG